MEEENKSMMEEKGNDNNNKGTGSTKNEIQMDDDENEEGGQRIHTFRQRRLTYTKSHLMEAINSSELQDLDVSDEDEQGDNKQPKALLPTSPMTHDNNVSNFPPTSKDTDTTTTSPTAAPDSKEEEQPTKDKSGQGTEPKNNSKVNRENKGCSEPLQSRIMHASAPPTPDDSNKRKRSLLYLHERGDNDSEDQQQESGGGGEVETSSSVSSPPQAPEGTEEWKKRRHASPGNGDESLPFPRHIVGTYSCHGIEPVFDDGDSNCNLPSCIAKINQDRGGVAFPFANNSRMALFAAYDGHGDGGEHIAQYALHEIPRRLEQHEDFLNGCYEKAFKDVFVDVDRDLALESTIEPLYSGCTACVALLKDKHLHFSNAGDSRAVIGRKNIVDGKVVFESLDMTVDQNPDSPGEQERIEKMGGFVSPPPEEGLSARVWLDCNYSQIGLAMSRSIGDHAVKPIGVIATPVVTKYELTDKDEFMVIATDGVWEFLSSQQVVDLVSKDLQSGKGSSEACQNLIEAAAAMWHRHEGDYRDDITALIIKVKELWDD